MAVMCTDASGAVTGEYASVQRLTVVAILCYPIAVPLALASFDAPTGWQIHPEDGPIEGLAGPYVVSGGWWLREIARDYYYALTRSGRWLWIYRDRCRQRWFMQGEVE